MRAAKLSCTTCSVSGDNTLVFDKPRKIPLLSEVFEAVKQDDLVMYLNVSRWNPPCFLLAVHWNLPCVQKRNVYFIIVVLVTFLSWSSKIAESLIGFCDFFALVMWSLAYGSCSRVLAVEMLLFFVKYSICCVWLLRILVNTLQVCFIW